MRKKDFIRDLKKITGKNAGMQFYMNGIKVAEIKMRQEIKFGYIFIGKYESVISWLDYTIWFDRYEVANYE